MDTRKKKLSLIIGGLIIFFAILAIGGVELTAQPSFCNSCHSMGFDYKTWQTSTHKDISCLKCHADSGLVGLVKVKMGGLNQVWVTATGTTPEKITAEVPNSRCLECHKKSIKPKGLDKINFDHTKHTEAKNDCTECHARVVHNEGKLTSKEVKTNCINCHTEKKVKVLKCSDCHQPTHKKANYQVTHSADVTKSKTDEALSTTECLDCHKKDWSEGLPGVGENFCSSCHKVSMPHKADFVKNHGAEAEKNQEACLQCHKAENKKLGSKASVCISCHKIEIPHKTGFKESHPEAYKKNPNACAACHSPAKEKAGSQAKACVSCHSKANVHAANWLGKHYSASKKADANCTTCHSTNGKALGFKLKTCSECHRQGHKASFVKTHNVKAKAKIINCTTCHKRGGLAVSCSTCHAVKIPHASNWKTEHGKTAKANKNACTICHSSKNPVNPTASYAKAGFCTSCHAAGGAGHPSNWVKIHKTTALQTTPVGIACNTCHKVRTADGEANTSSKCYSCHQANFKHSDTWDLEHGSYAKSNPTLCTVCHVRKNDCLLCHEKRW